MKTPVSDSLFFIKFIPETRNFTKTETPNTDTFLGILQTYFVEHWQTATSVL